MMIASIVDAGYFDSVAAFFRVSVVPMNQISDLLASYEALEIYGNFKSKI